MIYRLLTTATEMGFRYKRCAVPSGVDPMGAGSAYLNIFEEIPTDPFCNDFRIFKAPIKPYWNFADDLIVDFYGEQKELQDIMVFWDGAYVSECAKRIIQSVDAFSHQFWRVTIFDKDGKPYQGSQFYAFHMRTYLHVKSSGQDPKRTDFNINKTSNEYFYLPAIQHSQELRERVEKFHFWRHRLLDSIPAGPLYIGPKMMEVMKSSGLTGLKEFTVYGGDVGEYVAHV